MLALALAAAAAADFFQPIVQRPLSGGLAVAVPAVLAYNWLQRRNKSIAEDLSAFSNDVLGYLASNGAVRPAAVGATAKPVAAKPTTTTAGQTGGVQTRS